MLTASTVASFLASNFLKALPVTALFASKPLMEMVLRDPRLMEIGKKAFKSAFLSVAVNAVLAPFSSRLTFLNSSYTKSAISAASALFIMYMPKPPKSPSARRENLPPRNSTNPIPQSQREQTKKDNEFLGRLNVADATRAALDITRETRVAERLLRNAKQARYASSAQGTNLSVEAVREAVRQEDEKAAFKNAGLRRRDEN